MLNFFLGLLVGYLADLVYSRCACIEASCRALARLEARYSGTALARVAAWLRGQLERMRWTILPLVLLFALALFIGQRTFATYPVFLPDEAFWLPFLLGIIVGFLAHRSGIVARLGIGSAGNREAPLGLGPFGALGVIFLAALVIPHTDRLLSTAHSVDLFNMIKITSQQATRTLSSAENMPVAHNNRAVIHTNYLWFYSDEEKLRPRILTEQFAAHCAPWDPSPTAKCTSQQEADDQFLEHYARWIKPFVECIRSVVKNNGDLGRIQLATRQVADILVGTGLGNEREGSHRAKDDPAAQALLRQRLFEAKVEGEVKAASGMHAAEEASLDGRPVVAVFLSTYSALGFPDCSPLPLNVDARALAFDKVDGSSWFHMFIAVMMSFNGNDIAASEYLAGAEKRFPRAYQLALLMGDLWLIQDHAQHHAYDSYARAADIAKSLASPPSLPNPDRTLGVSLALDKLGWADREAFDTYATNTVRFAALQSAGAIANQLARGINSPSVPAARDIDAAIDSMRTHLQTLYSQGDAAHNDFYYESLATYALMLAGRANLSPHTGAETFACSSRALSEAGEHFRKRHKDLCVGQSCPNARFDRPALYNWVESVAAWRRFAQSSARGDGAAASCADNTYRQFRLSTAS